MRLRFILARMNVRVRMDSPTMFVNVHVQVPAAKNFSQRICPEPN
jgi:hypothetical protein